MVDDISPILRRFSGRRVELGLTQGAVARLAGVSQSYLSAIEKGKLDARLSTLQDVARALKMELVAVPAEDLATVRSIIGQGPAPSAKRLFEIEPD